MLKFRDADDFVCDSGSPVKETYSSKVLDDGRIVLTASGKINTDEQINSFRDDCDINVLMKRFENGDMTVMEKFRATPIYGDVTVFPTSYAEMLQLKIDVDRQFLELPVDVRQKFNNDSNQFLVSLGSKEWFSKLGISESSDVVVKEDSSDER